MHSQRIYKDHTSRKYISDFLVPCVGKDLKESEIGRRLSFVTQQQTEKDVSQERNEAWKPNPEMVAYCMFESCPDYKILTVKYEA